MLLAMNGFMIIRRLTQAGAAPPSDSGLLGASLLATIIQPPRCGATVCRTHLRLDAECGSHCDGNYACAQILETYLSG